MKLDYGKAPYRSACLLFAGIVLGLVAACALLIGVLWLQDLAQGRSGGRAMAALTLMALVAAPLLLLLGLPWSLSALSADSIAALLSAPLLNLLLACLYYGRYRAESCRQAREQAASRRHRSARGHAQRSDDRKQR